MTTPYFEAVGERLLLINGTAYLAKLQGEFQLLHALHDGLHITLTDLKARCECGWEGEVEETKGEVADDD